MWDDAPVKPVVVGIAGGSGSGKSTVARALARTLTAAMPVAHSRGAVVRLEMDAYYHDQSHRTRHEMQHDVNWDHLDAFDVGLLASHLGMLARGAAVEVPVYEFSTHTRRAETRRVEPAGVVIVEGVLLLADKRVRALCDLKVFLDVDADIRLVRRIRRDMADRGRSLDSILDQYLSTVHPMHEQYVEPSKRHADLIVPTRESTATAVSTLAASLQQRVSQAMAVERA